MGQIKNKKRSGNETGFSRIETRKVKTQYVSNTKRTNGLYRRYQVDDIRR